MNTESEFILEDKLIAQLVELGYESVRIDDEAMMLANLKRQLEIHNEVVLSDTEFALVLNHLNNGSVFERAHILRDMFVLKREDGENVRIRFLDTQEWCQNEYQVTHQVSIEGRRKTRYDVTILVNGLPLVQVELKRRGVELKEAFHQIQRYKRDSFDAGFGLFQYVQLFVVSNGVNTKYFSNNAKVSFEQTFYWTDADNERLSDLSAFAAEFLKPCHVSKMMTHYTVLTEQKIMKVLRPYQFYAVEKLCEQVKSSDDNAYIWHTTGSGKTLTSFKASQIIQNMPKVHKVLFVVDRKDLDFQTAREFNAFAKGSVDETTNTHNLIKKLNDEGTKLIVTTLQKLNNAIVKEQHLDKIAHLRDQKIVFIFDECHRSQFGDTHTNIKKFFTQAQMFGFTGTPIFGDNANVQLGQSRTTRDLFGECLHKYTIVDAIRDENVLKFSVEYVGRYKYKDSANQMDIEVEGIDTAELLASPERSGKIVDYILAHHDIKTHQRDFTAMFCVGSVEMLIQYYELFKQKQLASGSRPLKIATIFSFGANEPAIEQNGLIGEEAAELPTGGQIDQSKRDKLDEFINDYNAQFGTSYSTKDSQTYYNYYKDISKRVRLGEVDLLLVVNMFLTGFDSPKLNTLYVDKQLKYHGLVQAFSRTNRILDARKSQGNIVCFRNLKNATDEAIALFSNKNAKETVLVKPYTDYVSEFNQAVEKLLEITPTVQSVDELLTEEDELAFVTRYRELLRLMNILKSFADFAEHSAEDLAMDAQTFEDFKSKYLDIHDKYKRDNGAEKVSIINDVDFELDLIHRDEINVAYIINLLIALNGLPEAQREKRRTEINELLKTEVQLRSKRVLIEEFIESNALAIGETVDADAVKAKFDAFWTDKRTQAMQSLCDAEQVRPEALRELLELYLFEQRLPREQEIVDALTFQPKILERQSIIKRVSDKVKAFIDTFYEGMG